MEQIPIPESSPEQEQDAKDLNAASELIDQLSDIADSFETIIINPYKAQTILAMLTNEKYRNDAIALSESLGE